MKKNNAWRAIAKEVEIDPNQDPMLARTLQAIMMESSTIGKVPMPQGYEDHLLRSLRTKLPLSTSQTKSQKQNTAGLWTRISSTFTMPQFRIQAGAAIGFAVIALVVGVSLRAHKTIDGDSIGESMLLKAAKTSDVASVDSWISSISDSVSLTAGRDIASLSEEITKGLNSDDQKKVLNNFAGQQSGDI
jgi:hypothetical protein